MDPSREAEKALEIPKTKLILSNDEVIHSIRLGQQRQSNSPISGESEGIMPACAIPARKGKEESMANTTETLALDLRRSHVALIQVVRLGDISYDASGDTGQRVTETVQIDNPRLAIVGDRGETVPIDEVFAIELVQTSDNIQRVWMKSYNGALCRYLNG